MTLRHERVAKLLQWVVPIAAILCIGSWGYVSFRSSHSWDDAEPEILNQAWRLARGDGIYRSIEQAPYLHTAYPPVYFAVVALLLKVTGLSYIPAKLVSLISLLAIGYAMASLSQLWKQGQRSAWWMLCLLVLLPAVLYNVTRAHVQMLAVALSLISLVLFLKQGRLSLVASAVAAVLALYTKQTQIAVPLAIVMWLAFHDLRRLLIYAVTLLAAGLPPLLWLQWKTDGLFLEHIIGLNQLPYSASEIPVVLLHWAGPLVVLIGLAIQTVWQRWRQRDLEVIDFYFAAVIATTVITCGRLGAHSQYVVELAVVAAIVFLRATSTEAWSDRLVQLQALMLLVYAPLFVFVEEGRFGLASNRASTPIRKLLETSPGPVLSQQSSFTLFSRGEIPIQLFHFTALARQGKWDMNKLTVEVQRRTFSWVITEFPVESGEMTADDFERFTPAVVRSLRANYSRAETIPPYFIYRPVSR